MVILSIWLEIEQGELNNSASGALKSQKIHDLSATFVYDDLKVEAFNLTPGELCLFQSVSRETCLLV